MSDEPQFTVTATMPGASKALRQLAASARVTNPGRADEIEAHAKAFDAHNSQPRPGAGFIPRR